MRPDSVSQSVFGPLAVRPDSVSPSVFGPLAVRPDSVNQYVGEEYGNVEKHERHHECQSQAKTESRLIAA